MQADIYIAAYGSAKEQVVTALKCRGRERQREDTATGVCCFSMHYVPIHHRPRLSPWPVRKSIPYSLRCVRLKVPKTDVRT